MLLVKVRADDHIVLPKALVKKLGVSAGDYLEMDEQGGEVVIRSTKGTFPEKKSDGNLSKRGKWSQVAERLAEKNLAEGGIGETLRKTSREFRENFGFREPPHFEHTKK